MKKVCIVLLVMLLSVPAFAVSPRAISMGGAFVGVADDSDAVFYNPAGLGNLGRHELQGSYGVPYTDTTDMTFAGAFKSRYGTFAAGYDALAVQYKYVSSDPIFPSGNATYTVGDMILAYGYPVADWVSLGVKAHRMFEQMTGILGNADYQAYGLDFGVLFRPAENAGIGVAIENLYNTGFTGSYGIIYSLNPSTAVGFSYNAFGDRLLMALDINDNNISDTDMISSVALGTEIEVLHDLFLRGGCNFAKNPYISGSDLYGSPALGVGYRYAGLEFDYALQRLNGVKVDSHYFSLGFCL
ncbi:MAG: hypothetical protein ABIJ26_02880 [Candidatus Margulisiibacteriota bacterium]